MSDRSQAELHLNLQLDTGAGSDDEELDRATEQLRRRLLELDVESVVRPGTGEVPDGAKGVDAVTMGLILVQLLPAVPALHDIVQAVRTWLNHNPERSATLEIGGDRIEVNGITQEEQRELIRLWADRHTPR